MADLSTILTRPGYVDWVYDPARGRIDIVAADGSLSAWNVESQTYAATLSLGGSPKAIDISADGRFLVAGNSLTNTATSPATATLTRLDLATGAVDTIPIPLRSAAQKGVLDVVAGADGAAIFNRQSAQTGVNPYQQVALGAASPAPQPVAALAGLDPFERMTRSDDHRYVALQQGGITGSPMQIYDTTSGRLVAQSSDIADGALRYGDISAPAGLVAAVQYSSLKVFDLSLRLVADLGSLQSGLPVAGATFTDDGRQLLVWKTMMGLGGPATVLVLDTQTWRQVGAFSPQLTPDLLLAPASIGKMDVAGRVLVMDTGDRLELVDLSVRMKLTVAGGEGDDVLWGGLGQDSLAGGAGRDILTGGLGSDTLAGGAGSDLFNFAAGDAAPANPAPDVILDWESTDQIAFGRQVATSANYVEVSAGSYDSARQQADALIAARTASYVAVGVGSDVYVFADSRADGGGADDVVRLSGRALADVSAANIVATPGAAVASGGPTLPGLPPVPTGTTLVNVTGDMDAARLSDLLPAILTSADEDGLTISGADGLGLVVIGRNFDYVDEVLVGGTATFLAFNDVRPGAAPVYFSAQGVAVPAALLTPWLIADATQDAFQTILANADLIAGNVGADLIRGFAGDDFIYGRGGADTVYGGAGNDVIHAGRPASITTGAFTVGPAASTYLRGDEGDDYIVGGAAFDDINGNMGNDTASGGDGRDWVVGGKDNDMLFGDAGDDIVYGNLGADTCVGGEGADIVRGGQGDDILWGGAGDDYLSGDRGSDTITGGAGADLFHTFGDAGLDRVLDFNAAEGDRVLVDAGVAWTVRQSGGDTVIDMGGGGQMVLVGVASSALPPGWIVVG